MGSEPTVHLARLRLASLWLSQTARAVADNCLLMFVVLLVAGGGTHASGAAWYQVRAFFILPFLLFAPINGALANSLGKRSVLVGAAAFSLGAGVLLGLALPVTPAASWSWCLGVGFVMLGAAVYSPTRYALLPAVAQDAKIPLPRLNGWIETGSAGGIVVGMFIGVELFALGETGFPAALGAIAALNVVAMAFALPARFPSDVTRPEPPVQAVADFFSDCRRIAKHQPARDSLLGLATLAALVMTGTGAVLAFKGALDLTAHKGLVQECMALGAIGVAVGSLTASIQGHPYRSLGLAPLAVIGLTIALALVLLLDDPRLPIALLGFMGGLANTPLRAFYQAAVPADARGNAMAVSNTAERLMQVVAAGVLFALVQLGLSPTGQVVVLLVVAVAAAAFACWALRRVLLEQVTEVMLWPVYRFRVAGPGLERVPLEGPLLVIANHSAWFDPLWLGKVLPRQIIPMMTSDFYDLPVLRWLMKHVIGAIRVQASRFRREAPELQKAVKELDRGHCVVLFPEGRLRRDDRVGVRQFGRGVWHILNQRPQTPVVVCWIEGGWGSFCSYWNGLPTKNKRPDFWRHIDIAVAEPQIIPPEMIADHRATRRHLMQEVLNARGWLGLPVPQLELGKDEEEKGEDEKGEEPAREV